MAKINNTYLIHSLYENDVDKIMQIFIHGYFYASFYKNTFSSFYIIDLLKPKYVHLQILDHPSDFHVDNPFKADITLILSDQILYHQSWNYSLEWISDDEINKTTKVRYPNKSNNNVQAKYIIQVQNIIQIIKDHIKNVRNDPRYNIISHEILIKHKIDLHKYLIAIYSKNNLSPEISKYLESNYPNVKIINNVDDLNKI